MKKLYKNWFVHNMIGHPLSEVAYWVALLILGKDRAYDVSGAVHQATVPEHIKGEGRG
jgi:hypothetical protein